MSCSVKGSLDLDTQGAGTMKMDFTLAPFYGDFFEEQFDADLLIEETKDDLAKNLAIKSYSASREGNLYSGEISFNKFEDVISQNPQEKQTIFTMIQNGDESTLNIVFNRDNWNQMSSLVPLFSNPTIAMLGPSGSVGLTQEEYREMVLYPFEGYATSTQEALNAFDASELLFTVSVPNKIISQMGGEISGKSVTYQIPLVRMLMLDQELSYSVTYK